MKSYFTADKQKTEKVLCLWICRDSKILKSVMLLDVPIIVNSSQICTWELQGKLWSLILLWHGWEIGMFVLVLTPAWSDQRPCREVCGRSSQCSKTRTARNSIYILHRISEHKGGRLCNECMHISLIPTDKPHYREYKRQLHAIRNVIFIFHVF